MGTGATQLYDGLIEEIVLDKGEDIRLDAEENEKKRGLLQLRWRMAGTLEAAENTQKDKEGQSYSARRQ